jgi:hypothetical protein
VDKNDPWGERPSDPSNDPQFNLWEYPVQQWVQTQNLPKPTAPSGYDDVHTKNKRPKINIISPQNEGVYPSSGNIIVQITNQSAYPLTKLDFYINNVYVGTSAQSPFLFSFTPSQIRSITENNTLKVIATDAIYNRSEMESSFTVTN